MARLHEYQGKSLLAARGLHIPSGRAVGTPEAAREVAASLGGKVVLKVQAWITGRKAMGGVRFSDTPEQAESDAALLLGMRFGNFPVEEVLVEELLDIRHELFVSLTIDDNARAPMLLLDCEGGSGIEDRAESVARIPVSVSRGIDRDVVLGVLAGSSIPNASHEALADAIAAIVKTASEVEARSLEVNPLVVLADGAVCAADCRVTIDDYAVFRHPELGIEIARELDHPATDLERVAYRLEQEDHRGTFYFAQLPTEGWASTKGLIGFHGAGGGGSMMSMDAVTNEGFTLANFCDTSGNPSAAKVYRAARVILSQEGLTGYFGSGSGVASQEQFHSAYGLAKAFNELGMSLPVVVRLGGNAEDRAVDILEDACSALPGAVEGYRKDDTPAFCAERFTTLMDAGTGATSDQLKRQVPDWVGGEAEAFPIEGGHVWVDVDHCDAALTARMAEWSSGLLKDGGDGVPVLACDEETAAKADSEFIACEIECLRAGRPVLFVDLPITGIDCPQEVC
ncbi:MAG: acetate--CoA ligase family protein [Phycisphaerales bacterium]|jgi:succinyl-CoA synthetase beta subunit|nr:acetate--CoA ligase family protein [Phycisphaerales bacterium]